MGRQRVPRDRRPHDRPAKNERGTEHRDPVLLLDHDRHTSRFVQARSRACGEHPRIMTLGEEVEQWSAIYGSYDEAFIGAVDLHGQMIGGSILLERRSASIELKDRDVER